MLHCANNKADVEGSSLMQTIWCLALLGGKRLRGTAPTLQPATQQPKTTTPATRTPNYPLSRSVSAESPPLTIRLKPQPSAHTHEPSGRCLKAASPYTYSTSRLLLRRPLPRSPRRFHSSITNRAARRIADAARFPLRVLVAPNLTTNMPAKWQLDKGRTRAPSIGTAQWALESGRKRRK